MSHIAQSDVVFHMKDVTFLILLQQLPDFLNARQHSEHMCRNHVPILGMSGLPVMDWGTFHSMCCGCHALDLINHVWDCPRPQHLKSGNFS